MVFIGDQVAVSLFGTLNIPFVILKFTDYKAREPVNIEGFTQPNGNDERGAWSKWKRV